MKHRTVEGLLSDVPNRILCTFNPAIVLKCWSGFKENLA